MFFRELESIHLMDHFKVGASSLMGGIGLIFMIRGLSRTDLQFFSFYNLIGTFITFILAWLYTPILSNSLILSFILIITGYLLFVWPFERNLFLKLNSNYLLMVFFFALSGMLHWFNLKSFSPFYVALNQEFVVIIVSLIVIIFPKQTQSKNFSANLKHQLVFFGAAFTILSALITGFFALKYLNPIVNNLATLIISPLTFLGGWIFFHERFQSRKFVALLVILLGVSTFILGNK